MADHDTKTEVTKDVLAPAEGPREELIATAVKFLLNPKVQQSPLYQKKSFLERKGLTKEEIETALKRSGIKQDDSLAPKSYTGTTTEGAAPPEVPAKVVTPSRWSRTKEVVAVAAIVSGVSYAAYKFYAEFLKPWLLNTSSPASRLDDIERSVSELQASILQTLTKVQETLTTVQDTLQQQQEKVQLISHDLYNRTASDSITSVQGNQQISEIKSELTSIKGLLLSRKQFPPTPQSTPVLPAWQLQSSSSKTDVKDMSDIPPGSAQVTTAPPGGADVTSDTSPVQAEEVVSERTVDTDEKAVESLDNQSASQVLVSNTAANTEDESKHPQDTDLEVEGQETMDNLNNNQD